MEKRANNKVDYRNIRNLQELQYQRRLLSSKIEHQEMMVVYKLGCVWEFISPTNLMSLGVNALKTHSRPFNIIYNAVGFVKNILKRRRS